MTEQELEQLKKRAEADEPAAMYAYAQAVRATDPKEANKYIVLAAQLGNPEASEMIGDRFQEQGDLERARFYYKTGAKAGFTSCAVKMAMINLCIDENKALHELEELAESGIKSACIALAAYYKSKGNRKEYNFWRSLAK
ncbi:MAG: hypothetical protein J1F69_05305 [Clostridiales bacterium]|nr:hypothetical protein [Clostridiales bacterium]